MGKVMEKLAADRLANAAEGAQLLADEQMGNRRHRSVETACYVITDQVHAAWAEKAMASLLALDIRGAFDTVHHLRLISELKRKGVPDWLVRWIESFLSDRETTLFFDGADSAPFRPTC